MNASGDILLAQQVTFQNIAFVNVCFFVFLVLLTIFTFTPKYLLFELKIQHLGDF